MVAPSTLSLHSMVNFTYRNSFGSIFRFIPIHILLKMQNYSLPNDFLTNFEVFNFSFISRFLLLCSCGICLSFRRLGLCQVGNKIFRSQVSQMSFYLKKIVAVSIKTHGKLNRKSELSREEESEIATLSFLPQTIMMR